MRQDVDADAERAHVAHRLEDNTGDANLVQRERRRQPANAAAGNDHALTRLTVTHTHYTPAPMRWDEFQYPRTVAEAS